MRSVALYSLRELGSQAREALPDLARIFHDGDDEIRQDVLITVESIGPTEELVSSLVEVLSSYAEKSDLFIALVLTALRQFGPKAALAVPAITDILNDKLVELNSTEDGSAGYDDLWLEGVQTLQAIGANAEPAIPVLIKLLKHESIWLDEKQEIAKALDSIGTSGIQ